MRSRVICSAVISILAQLAPVLSLAEPSPVKSRPGAYAPSGLTEEARAAANFAVQEQGKREHVPLTLHGITSVEKQIVAGTNYRMIVIVEQRGSVRQAKAVVFRGLNSQFSLSSWEWY